MPHTLATYNKIVRNFKSLKKSSSVYMRAAEVAYISQFGNRNLDKEKITLRLTEINTLSRLLLTEIKLASEILMDSEIVTFGELTGIITELTEFRNTVQMSLVILAKRPTQSIVFTDRTGKNDFVFNFT